MDIEIGETTFQTGNVFYLVLEDGLISIIAVVRETFRRNETVITQLAAQHGDSIVYIQGYCCPIITIKMLKGAAAQRLDEDDAVNIAGTIGVGKAEEGIPSHTQFDRCVFIKRFRIGVNIAPGGRGRIIDVDDRVGGHAGRGIAEPVIVCVRGHHSHGLTHIFLSQGVAGTDGAVDGRSTAHPLVSHR